MMRTDLAPMQLEQSQRHPREQSHARHVMELMARA
jgi:hypothetical protein